MRSLYHVVCEKSGRTPFAGPLCAVCRFCWLQLFCRLRSGFPRRPTGRPLLLFPLSLALGLLVIVSFSMLIYISSFYTISTLGIRVLSSSVVEFFSGAVIPLPFFPEQLQAVINVLPFASIQSTPFLIYTGHLAGRQALQSVAVQLLWLAGLLVLGRMLMGRALKKVVVQGG